ncbi:MAG: hypothetical protein AB7V50_03195 [Vampirovibrionia bacterium]
MTDRINEKVINIFDRHSRKATPSNEEEYVYTSPDGFKYVHIKNEENGKPFKEDKLIEKADSQWYIVKVLESHTDSPSIKNYKVSGERLVEFFQAFMAEDRPGRILEIDKYFPEGLA